MLVACLTRQAPQRSMTTSPVIHSVGKQHAVATLDGRLVIGLWVKTPFLDSVTAYHVAGTAAAKAFPEGIGFLTIADRPGTPPDADTRNVYAAMLKEFRPVSRASALVITGGSALGSSVVRGVATGLMMMAQRSNLKMFADTREAGAWLQSHAGAHGVALPSAGDTMEAVKALQARMAQSS